MKKIQDSSASATRPAVTASGTVGWFRHANALTKIKATKVTVDWLNDLQGSFMDLFTRTGITATGGEAGDRNLYDAIMALVSPKIDQTTGDARYVKKAGDTMTGLLTLSGDPAANMQASTKQYADTKYAKSGGTVSGSMTVTGLVSLNDDLMMTNASKTITLSKDATSAMHAVTKQSHDLKFDKAGGTVTGAMTVNGLATLNDDLAMANAAKTIILSKDPTAAMHAATKQYVDPKFDKSGGHVTGATVFDSSVDIVGATAFGNTVTLAMNPFAALQAATKQYVDGTVLKSGNGYVILPNGLYLQWGNHSYTSGGGTPQIGINFPVPFPNACFNVQLTRHENTSYVTAAVQVHTINASNFTFIDGDTSPNALYWFAIGY